uniref:Uncharacterized protein n=1 Tax=Cannabis sativa TaxID=3483 RepID=A0A803QJF3_CANSA
MSNAEPMELEEELTNNVEDDSGDSNCGYNEFFMYMTDADMEDIEQGSDDDSRETVLSNSDSSVKIIEKMDKIGDFFWGKDVHVDYEDESPTDEAQLEHTTTHTTSNEAQAQPNMSIQ